MNWTRIYIIITIFLLFISCAGTGELKNSDEIELSEETIIPRVGVFNGCGIDGLGVSLGERLIEDGYRLSLVENWTDYEGEPRFYFRRTVLFYNKEVYKSSAESLSDLLGVKVVDFRSDLYVDEMDVGVIIGEDFNEGEMIVISDEEEELPEISWVVMGDPPESIDNGIYVSKKYHTLTLFKDGEIIKQYPCATGVDYSTPEGTFTVTCKLIDPTWYWEGKAIPPGPDNGLGTRYIAISKKSYGVHGTNEPSSIGRDASHGCVRMYNRDVEQLYEYIDVGDIVKIGP